jgi:Undecaprenyl-phosphate galactose phosphotransferase WbaP
VGGLLLLSDLSIVVVSFVVAAEIRRALIPYIGGSVNLAFFKPLIYLSMAYIAIMFFLNNLYPGYGKTAVKEIERTSKLISIVYLILGGTTFLLNTFEQFPRSIFLLSWAFCTISIPAMRFFIRNRILKYSWYGVPVILVSDGTDYSSILTALENCRRMGWNPAAIFNIGFRSSYNKKLSIPVVDSWDEIIRFKEETGVKIGIFTAEHNPENAMWLQRISENFKVVTLIIPYFNLGSLWVKPRDLEGYLGLEVTYHLLGEVSKKTKRLVDLVGSLILLVFFSPVFLILAILILIESSRPIFYTQERLGRGKQAYAAIKFRSMVNNAENILMDFLNENPEAMAEYQEFHKLTDDPRITKVGKFLRKYSLDELPQLFNVIKGDMSLVGPRAYMPSELDEIGEFSGIIFRVRPGMTGWWQVMGRQTTTFQARLRMDEYYISNWSLWMDLYIFYKTIWVVLSGTGT